jgi:hypothetical protein
MPTGRVTVVVPYDATLVRTDDQTDDLGATS